MSIASAVATRINIPAGTGVLIVGTNLNRDSFSLLTFTGSVFLGYGNATPTSTQDLGPVPLANVYRDTTYNGPVYGAVPSGASAVVTAVDFTRYI